MRGLSPWSMKVFVRWQTQAFRFRLDALDKKDAVQRSAVDVLDRRRGITEKGMNVEI